VDIFDTNTHSTDWHHRHEEIDDGFPNGTVQSEKNSPDTSPIAIGDDVWIGKYSAILKGVSIGSRSIVGTRSVVTKSCPEDSVVVGNPANYRPLLTNHVHNEPE
jgi:acetyltransferase-like isoleucine patch superfamily enzyme